MPEKEKYPWRTFLKDYWILLKGRRLSFLFYTLLKSLSDLIPFAIAYILGSIIDFFTIYKLETPLTEFYFLVGAIAVLGGFQVWLRFFAKVKMQTIAANLRKEIRVKVMSKLMDLELKWHEQEETGSKIQKINTGGENIFNGINDFLNQGIQILTGLLGSLIIFLFLDWRYIVYALIYTVIYLLGESYFNKKVSYWQDQLNKVKEKVSGKLHEAASNVLTIKSLGLKDVFKERASAYEKEHYEVWLKKRDIKQQKFKTIKIFAALGYAGFILIIGLDVVKGSITVGSILVFASYFSKLKSALDTLTNRVDGFIRVKSAVGRFMTIFGVEVFEREEEKLSHISKNWKQIEFRNVTFKYHDKYILKNFNLTINRNEKIGIVGRTGCGKSTIVKLLLGLYYPQKGRILIDGKDLKEYKHKSLTDTTGVVLQESEMFNLSLLENIAISSIRRNLNMFKKAVNISQLKPLIKKLPLGLNTLMGEKGYKLSGGERQRVGLARAIYKDKSLLVLDEATSALDSKTEDLIQKAIDKHLKEKTILIIAHRLSTLRNVNKIIVMEKGKIVELGTFNGLVRKKGKFYKLYKLQRKK